MPKKALTLIEIIVAVVILSLIIGGLVNVFISARRWIIHAHLRTAGSEIAKHFLDPLAVQVRQDQWGRNCLSSDSLNEANPVGCDTSSWTDPSTRVTYTPEYNHSAKGNLRRVALTISWPKERLQ